MCDKQSDNLDDETSDSLMHEEQQSMGNGVAGQQSSLEGYNFTAMPNNSQLSYRVIQVGGDANQQSTLSLVPVNNVQSLINQATGNGSSGPQVAFVTNALNGDGEGSNQTTTSSSYSSFPASSSNADLASSTESQDHSNVASGQFYVMMSSQEMLQPSPARTIVSSRKMDGGRGSTINLRDSNRRTQHNEVERRRRDKINSWIMKLSKLVPDCAGDNTKQGQSKGGILAKACDYIMELKSNNQRLSENVNKCERIQVDYEVLRLELDEKKQENLILRQTLQSHGIEVAITNTSNNSSH